MALSEEGLDSVRDGELLRMTADVVASYVSKNPVNADQLGELIHSVHDSLKNIDGAPAEIEEEPQKPAVSIRKSVQPEYLICLEDGKKLKMLKRHLRTAYNMTADDYRLKWGLGADYPMVAPNYAAQRSAFAKSIGLGRGARGGGRKKG